VALIYNWWSWYVRLANPKSRLEAKASRPKLLSAVARLGQCRTAPDTTRYLVVIGKEPGWGSGGIKHRVLSD